MLMDSPDENYLKFVPECILANIIISHDFFVKPVTTAMRAFLQTPV